MTLLRSLGPFFLGLLFTSCSVSREGRVDPAGPADASDDAIVLTPATDAGPPRDALPDERDATVPEDVPDAGSDAVDADVPPDVGTENFCDELIMTFRSCGILGEGAPPPCEEDEFSLPYGECQAECIRAASCGELRIALCEGEQVAIDACLDKCDSDRWMCGDGAFVASYALCDGNLDCDDGSDEEDCEPYTYLCDSGERVPVDFRCDEDEDCEDGSDEMGCPVFVCDSGERVLTDFRCDEDEDCEDGSDEEGCAPFICGDE